VLNELSEGRDKKLVVLYRSEYSSQFCAGGRETLRLSIVGGKFPVCGVEVSR
jgi:hypothetical protein